MDDWGRGLRFIARKGQGIVYRFSLSRQKNRGRLRLGLGKMLTPYPDGFDEGLFVGQDVAAGVIQRGRHSNEAPRVCMTLALNAVGEKRGCV